MRHSVFTLEVCAAMPMAPGLLEELRPIVQTAPAHLSRNEAWGRHAAAAEAILRSLHAVERGCWEYFDDEARAMAMFADWCKPILGQGPPRQPQVWEGAYRDAGRRYLTFTMVYLLARDSPSDVQIRRACRIPAQDLWRRTTFRRLLLAARMLSFASVKADAMYLLPRDGEWGLTPEELGGQGYQYLRVLEQD